MSESGTRIVDATPENRIESYREGSEILQSQSFVQAAAYDDPILQGTVISLDGPSHLERRRLENSLFVAPSVRHYEEIVDSAVAAELQLARHELRLRGDSVDLVRMLKRITMRLAATMAGIELGSGSEETERLLEYVERMTAGILALQFSSDANWQDVLDDGVEAKEAFRTQFFEPSRARCPHEADERTGTTSLLATLASDAPRWSDEEVLREVAFYLMAATHTMTQAVISTLIELDAWVAKHPDRTADLRRAAFLERVTHEALRLRPPDPGMLRRAVSDVTLSTGRRIRSGETAYIDIALANRDRSAFGSDAGVFDPERVVPPQVRVYGLTFGAGPHMCIGQRLASGRGRGTNGGRNEPDGVVTKVVAALLAAGINRDPGHVPRYRAESMQATVEEYHVTFSPISR